MSEKNEVENLESEKVVFVLDIDERIVEEELEQIRKNAEAKNSSSIKNKPVIVINMKVYEVWNC